MTLRETIQFYLIDCKTLLGKLIDIFIIVLNLLICGIVVMETYPISEFTRKILFNIEIVVVVFFILEYIARLYGARQKIKHLYDIYSLIDLVAILPTIALFVPGAQALASIRVIRSFRAFRIFRFLRFTKDPYFFFGNITWHFLKVVRLLLTILIIFFVSSGLFWQTETVVNPMVNNFGDAFYFTVVALTTVGFGDIIPVSTGGRWVTVLMIISGIVFIPWQASQIIKEWSRMSGKRRAICKKCGLTYHDKDASHCKSCGHSIYQEFDG
jgi:voltage-gated potassium channel